MNTSSLHEINTDPDLIAAYNFFGGIPGGVCVGVIGCVPTFEVEEMPDASAEATP